MDVRRSFRGLPLGGFAAVGVVLGHWIAYGIGVPNARLRSVVLQDTGHAYWDLAVKVVAGVAFAGAGALALRMWAGEATDRGRSRPHVFVGLLWRLAVVQLVAFTAMELSERLAAGAPVATLWGHHVFVLGLGVQVLVAAVAAVVALAFTRVVEWLVGVIRGAAARAPRRVTGPGLPAFIPAPRTLRGAVLLRAPPSA